MQLSIENVMAMFVLKMNLIFIPWSVIGFPGSVIHWH